MFITKTINQYIWNCYIYQRSKTSWNKFNELLHSLLILEQQWKNIVMNFIIDLSFLKDKNIILTMICRLTKKWHYISCSIDDKEITAKKTAELMLQWIYQIHDLLDFIVQIETFNLSSFYESFFAKDWALIFNYSLSITLKSMIKVNESIRMLKDIFDSSVHTCRMTELSYYSWLSSLIIMLCSQSFSRSLSF